jgi:hypothetical protein
MKQFQWQENGMKSFSLPARQKDCMIFLKLTINIALATVLEKWNFSL